MQPKPKCIIVTGRPGAGKTTLSKKLAQELWLPVINRDEIKEGYVNSFGVKHDDLPADANAVVTHFFFDLVRHYLSNNISLVAEAAFQHKLWATLMPSLFELSQPYIVICSIEAQKAAERHLQRGLANPEREFYHGDPRVKIYRETGEIAPPDEYQPPDFPVPTFIVDSEGEYSPSIAEIAARIRG